MWHRLTCTEVAGGRPATRLWPAPPAVAAAALPPALLASLLRRLVVRAVDAPVATDLQAELSSPAAVSDAARAAVGSWERGSSQR